jgi:hypothetical protein
MLSSPISNAPLPPTPASSKCSHSRFGAKTLSAFLLSLSHAPPIFQSSVTASYLIRSTFLRATLWHRQHVCHWREDSVTGNITHAL